MDSTSLARAAMSRRKMKSKLRRTPSFPVAPLRPAKHPRKKRSMAKSFRGPKDFNGIHKNSNGSYVNWVNGVPKGRVKNYDPKSQRKKNSIQRMAKKKLASM